NPIAITLSRAKTDLINNNMNHYIEECTQIIELAKQDLYSGRYQSMPKAPSTLFHEDSANEIMCVKHYFDNMSNYLKGAYFGAIALTARGNNDYKWTS